MRVFDDLYLHLLLQNKVVIIIFSANDTMSMSDHKSRSNEETRSDGQSYLGDQNGSMLNVSISEEAKTTAGKSTEKPSCRECGKTFSSRSSLKRHTNIQMPNKIRCSGCNQYFKTEQEKLTHINKKHSNNVCHICGKSYKRISDLNTHMRSHDEDATASFSCPFDRCTKKFLKLTFCHLNTHNGHEPYECQSCLSKFKIIYDRDSHFTQCARLTTIKCDICQQTFTYRTSLYNHKNTQGGYLDMGVEPPFKYTSGLTSNKKRKQSCLSGIPTVFSIVTM